MRAITLTDVDIEVFGFIVSHKKTHNGNSPSLRDIVENTRSASTSTAYKSIRKLELGGYLKLDNNKARNITIRGGVWSISPTHKMPQSGEEL